MTGKPIVAVLCGARRPPGMRAVETAAEVRYAGAADLPQALPGADVLLVWDFMSTACRLQSRGPGPARGPPSMGSHCQRRRGPAHVSELVDSTVVLTNSRGIFDRPIAEYVLGLILLFAKDFRGITSTCNNSESGGTGTPSVSTVKRRWLLGSVPSVVRSGGC